MPLQVQYISGHGVQVLQLLALGSIALVRWSALQSHNLGLVASNGQGHMQNQREELG